jgi:hypothetical protein
MINTLDVLVERSLQVHEVNLGKRHGKATQRAGRTRPMFKRYGTVGALTRLKCVASPPAVCGRWLRPAGSTSALSNW